MPFNSILSWVTKKRIHQVELFKNYPVEVQNESLIKLMKTAKDTTQTPIFGCVSYSGTWFTVEFEKGPLRTGDDFKSTIGTIPPEVPFVDFRSMRLSDCQDVPRREDFATVKGWLSAVQGTGAKVITVGEFRKELKE